MTVTPTRVLVVDDNPTNLELVSVLLEAEGYTVTQAPSAEEGLRLARAERPDLILMDIRLPGMDGYAAVRALKQDPGTRGIPTAALTAGAMKADEDRVRAAGFDDYITKPIDTHRFRETVARLLHAPRSEQ